MSVVGYGVQRIEVGKTLVVWDSTRTRFSLTLMFESHSVVVLMRCCMSGGTGTHLSYVPQGMNKSSLELRARHTPVSLKRCQCSLGKGIHVSFF